MDILQEKLTDIEKKYDTVTPEHYDEARRILSDRLAFNSFRDPNLCMDVLIFDTIVDKLNKLETGLTIAWEQMAGPVFKSWESMTCIATINSFVPMPPLGDYKSLIIALDDLNCVLVTLRQDMYQIFENSNALAASLEQRQDETCSNAWRVVLKKIIVDLQVAQLKVPWIQNQAEIYSRRLSPDQLLELNECGMDFTNAWAEYGFDVANICPHAPDSL